MFSDIAFHMALFHNKVSRQTLAYYRGNIKEEYLAIILGLFFLFLHQNINCGYSLEVPCRGASNEYPQNIEGCAQDYGNSNIFLKPLFRGNLDPFVNNANLGAIAHTSNGT